MARFDEFDTEDRVRSVLRPRNILFALIGAIGISAVFGGYYVVDQTERAGVRRFGVVTTQDVIQPGIHFKLPFVDTVDELTTTLVTHHLEPFTVNTVDNQMVTLDISINYDIPDDAVFHLLYQVGRRGDGAIKTAINSITRDRVSRVMSSKNTNYISEQREKIQGEILASVSHDLRELLKLNVVSLQIGPFGYSEAFKQSNEQAVLAKNVAIREENQKKVIEYQADQRVIQAKGEADQKVQAARGQKESQILAAQGTAEAQLTVTQANAKALVLQAEADKRASELRGTGDAVALKAIVEAAGGPDKYVAKLQAEAAQKWQGGVPQMVFGGDKGGTVAPIFPMNIGNTSGTTPR